MSDLATHYLVDGALCLLAGFSALTWGLILYKAFFYARLAAQDRRFSAVFWHEAKRDPSIALAGHEATLDSSRARLARVCHDALAVAPSTDSAAHASLAAWDKRDTLERLLAQQIQRERRVLESGLILLASIANVSPFVGLFGTVFGIVHALHTMSGAAGGIDAVAGPIGQALFATGVGIAVAIPAVLAYNLFLRRLNVTVADLDDFATDLIGLAQRNGFRVGRPVNLPAGDVLPLTRTQEMRA